MTKKNLINATSAILFLGLSQNVWASVCSPYDYEINGCSFFAAEAIGIGLDRCISHDQCYRVIGNTKGACDKEFRNALRYDCFQVPIRLAQCLLVAEGAYEAVRLESGHRGYDKGQARSVRYFSNTADKLRAGLCSRVLNAPAWTTTESRHGQAHVVRQMYKAYGLEEPRGNTLSGLMDFLTLSGADVDDKWRFTLASYIVRNEIGVLENTVTHENFVNDVITGNVQLPDRISPPNNNIVPTAAVTEEFDEILAPKVEYISRRFSSVLNTSM